MYINDRCLAYVYRNMAPGALVRLTSGKHAVVEEPHYCGYIWVRLNSGDELIVHPDNVTVLPLI